MEGRKSDEGRRSGGIFGGEKRLCFRMAFQTRYCSSCQFFLARKGEIGRTMQERRKRTCHTKGIFLMFARTRSRAAMRDLLPGPVTKSWMSRLKFTFEPAIVIASADTPAIVLRGSAIADAMVSYFAQENYKERSEK